MSNTSPPRILVAGIGNIFFGDDAFGSEVAQRLMRRPHASNVHVEDFGIRGLDLTYRLLDDCDIAILVDAAPRGKPPGTVCLIEPDCSTIPPPQEPGAVMIDTHNMDPVKVLSLVTAMGGRVGRILVVGCEPQTLGSEDNMQMGLSPLVQAAVDEAVILIESLLANFNSNSPPPVGTGVA